MLRKYFLEGIDITKKDFFIVFILLFNTFTWYYMTLIMIGRLPSDPNLTLLYRAIYFTTALGSSIVGSVFSDRVRSLRFLKFWMISGVATSLLYPFIDSITIPYVFVILAFSGISFGLGMPQCLAYFADCTIVENRGRIGGVIFLATNMGALPFAISLMMFNLTINSIILAIWRALGLVVFLSLNPSERIVTGRRKRYSFRSIFYNKSFFLYFIPWSMFSFIDIFEKSILRDFIGLDFYSFILVMEPIIGSLSAFAGGLLADIIGRKRVVIYGFISLGLAYAIIGIAPNMLIPWYFYLVIDGVATGML